jgi:hypothetical protein
MFEDARSDWADMKNDLMAYEHGKITREQLFLTVYQSFSTIETLLNNEVNFDEKPEDEKV